MPLPPIPGTEWLRFTADKWRRGQQAQLDQLRETASAWDLHAQAAIHGIGDTFSGLGTAVQKALPALPPPPPMPTPQLELPQPVQDVGAAIGGAFSDLGTGLQSGVQGAREAIQAVAPPAPDWSQQAQAAVDSISGAAGGGLDALTDPATYGRAAGIAPLPPGLEGIRPGLQAATQNAAQAVDTLATNPEAVAAAARTVNRLTPTGMIGSLAGQIQEGTTPRQLGREVVQGLPALGALGTLAPTPGAIAGNVLGSVAEQGALGLGLPEGVAGGAGFLADVLTPDPGTAARVASRAPGALEGLGDLAQSAPRFGVDTLTGGLDTAGAALDDAVLGIRRGQRGIRAPRLSPEQAAQRAADGAAEQRLFDAIQKLWRQGPEGEALADDLRFLAVGKGEEGEAAARALLTRKGLGDLLPPGVIPDATPAGEGFLGAATRATDPFLARGALTGGERAFDIGAGTAGGVLGAATADEDATWQERAGRGVLGASLGALGGANARHLARRLGSETDTLGIAAGKAPAAAGDTLGRAGRVASDVSQAMGSLPLLSVPGLAANFSGGALRTIERVLGEGFEGRPIDALVDLGGILKEIPGAARRLPEAVRRGPTADAPGVSGPSVDPADLFSRSGKLPFLATAGTRLNAATDQFWRDLNEAGALGVAERRGLSSEQAAEHVAKAGDFATFGGPNSPVARGLTAARAKLNDPNATPAEKATGFAVQAFAPYVMMPERLLRAAVETVFPLAPGHVSTLVRGIRTGDADAMREGASRMALAGVVGTTLWNAAAQGALTGPAPSDQKERLRREALGAQWETINIPGLGPQPLRYFGAFGQSASAIAAIQDAVASGQAKGDDFPKHLATAAGEAMKWTLDESYARDFGRFLRDVQQGRGPQSIAGTVGSAPGRLVAPVAGVASAFDPYERETSETPLGGVVGNVASRSGLRQLLPERIDPTTGEAQRRAGNVVTRYLGAARGAEETPENTELARHGLSPRVIQDGKFAGEAQSVDAVRKLRQAYGAETGKAVREVQKSPAYQKASDPEKKKLLEKALRDADFEAELRIGDGVKRSAKAQAAWEYSATAKYAGAPKDGDANEIRRYNRSVSQARAARTEARKSDPKNPGRAEAEWARANPEEAKLARRTSVSATTLRKKKAEIYSKNGVKP